MKVSNVSSKCPDTSPHNVSVFDRYHGLKSSRSFADCEPPTAAIMASSCDVEATGKI
jgi:hypothetical protein